MRGFVLRLRLPVTLIAASLLLWSCSREEDSGKMETLTVAVVPTELNALFYIAEEQSFFASNGLRVHLKEDYDSGATATTAMLNGEAEVALAAEFVIMRQAFNKKDIASFGTIAKYENTFMIWRADRGIKTFEDLKGKKIGVTLTTISEFYLGRTLDLNGVKIHQVTLVDTRAAESGKALANGEVDAVVTWEPWVTQIHRRMGNEVITRTLQSSQYAYWNLVSTRDWRSSHSDTIRKLMKALTQAEGYLSRHQEEAKAIVGKRMKFDEAFMEIVWQRYQFSLSLEQALIAAMEDEARWMIRNGLTTEAQIPDFINYVYTEGLKSVKPEAVSVIR
jgi:ABC-type nitrate/sulfonate/bicarbonate transport system substrate-binding protein